VYWIVIGKSFCWRCGLDLHPDLEAVSPILQIETDPVIVNSFMVHVWLLLFLCLVNKMWPGGKPMVQQIPGTMAEEDDGGMWA